MEWKVCGALGLPGRNRCEDKGGVCIKVELGSW